MLTITNTQKGPRGVNTVSGPVLLDPKQTIEVEVYEREKQHIDATGWFDVDGSYAENPALVTAAAAPISSGEDVNAARIAQLTEQVSLLTGALSAAMSRGAPPETKASEPAGLIAKHAGGGSWFVYDGDEKLGEAMTKEDAEAFNKLSDADKAALVKKG
ncbi:hypothetical protein [Bosea sp. UC22_33]|uniref:hypothetical protein n=1 Tax=Bosea sp. UC22_33 TaxID=3350165 RepID=UPI00366C8567